MRFLMIGVLLIEFAKFSLSQKRHDQVFGEWLLSKIEEGHIWGKVKPTLLVFVIVSTLNARAYSGLFRVIRLFGPEVPWDGIRVQRIQQVFEVALIADQFDVARYAAMQLKDRVSGKQTENFESLLAWRAGRIADSSTIDMDTTYFVSYPAYDEYFKGRISFEAGRLTAARDHYLQCLQIAPAHATELRADARRRLEAIDAGSGEDAIRRSAAP